jgi:hypothetical protein
LDVAYHSTELSPGGRGAVRVHDRHGSCRAGVRSTRCGHPRRRRALVAGPGRDFLAPVRERKQGLQRLAPGVRRYPLLGLEILVAADLVRTVIVAPTLDNVLVLGLIVLIRTFLSFSLETEIEGVPPWRRMTASGTSIIRRASRSGP